MSAGAIGVKIICNGRLGGAEMSRMETQKTGSIPLSRLQAKVDYGFAASFTTYGAIGVRVWLYKGLYRDISEDSQIVETGQAQGEGGEAPAPREPRRRHRGDRPAGPPR